ncbi:acyl-CoA thioesterase [Halobacillus karajensis]|uniref:Acyl-CoA thioester hydrolase YbgC n=1 Tax=Halobacillus karajensis TaxID=195088 RepID=A0A024P383_9BACI|nr:thioesterase family protein [Halobacillus karajensis]CDQ19622.1 Acyl-CoA thioester hydrolase YbgC [Halobacillus karajensis]CDQ22082.1 Acyl-CoA thioester hydrolase YbgC [Halobacillus karajensis]CDQ27923.1 Acyl-CoA thioester hydrolase YbgC [Halobacillus karajensis]
MKVNETPIQVRYQETDMMGVVYHANYLVWFEIGRTAFIEGLGFLYSEIEQQGVVSPVIDAQVSFKKPVRYGDEVHIRTWVENYDGLRVAYGYEVVVNNDEIAVTGVTKHVIVKKDTFKPVSIRRSFPDWHEAYLSAMES